jgi:hypothetical protein
MAATAPPHLVEILRRFGADFRRAEMSLEKTAAECDRREQQLATLVARPPYSADDDASAIDELRREVAHLNRLIEQEGDRVDAHPLHFVAQWVYERIGTDAPADDVLEAALRLNTDFGLAQSANRRDLQRLLPVFHRLHESGSTATLFEELLGRWPVLLAEVGLVAQASGLSTAQLNEDKWTKPSAPGGTTKTQGDRKKRNSRRKMRDRTKDEMFMAALRAHHRYERPVEEFNDEPASTRQIEKLTNGVVSDSTARRLLTSRFGSVSNYRVACANGTIRMKLALNSGDGPKLMRDLRDEPDADADE